MMQERQTDRQLELSPGDEARSDSSSLSLSHTHTAPPPPGQKSGVPQHSL